MFRNYAECVRGILKYVDPIMVSEQQAQKESSNKMSEMADLSSMLKHTTEVLIQLNN